MIALGGRQPDDDEDNEREVTPNQHVEPDFGQEHRTLGHTMSAMAAAQNGLSDPLILSAKGAEKTNLGEDYFFTPHVYVISRPELNKAESISLAIVWGGCGLFFLAALVLVILLVTGVIKF